MKERLQHDLALTINENNLDFTLKETEEQLNKINEKSLTNPQKEVTQSQNFFHPSGQIRRKDSEPKNKLNATGYSNNFSAAASAPFATVTVEKTSAPVKD